MPLVVPIQVLQEDHTIAPVAIPKNSKISIDQKKKEILALKPELKVWNTVNQPHPHYATGNSSRNEFKWNCNHSNKGKFFQNTVKYGMEAAIKFVHGSFLKSEQTAFIYTNPQLIELDKFLKNYTDVHFRLLRESPGLNRQQDIIYKVIDIVLGNKKSGIFQSIVKYSFEKSVNVAHKGFLRYDKDAFVYDDPRLKNLEAFSKAYASQAFDKKRCETMHKVIDVVLGLQKEDIAYRARALDAANQFIRQFTNEFVITEEDKKNLEQWQIFDIANKFIKQFPNGFELTELEKKNIERWG